MHPVKATKYFYPPALKPRWFLIDAKNQSAGRLATKVAQLLSGKILPQYTPNVAPPIFVVVVNAGQLKFTGKKLTDKIYFRHSGRPGGLKQKTLRARLEQDPTQLFTEIVSKMLAKNRLRTAKLAHLKVFAGREHPYEKIEFEQF